MSYHKNSKPVIITIKRLGINGEGLGYYQKKIIFIPGALPGEVVVARITKRRPHYLEGELVRIKEKSPDSLLFPKGVDPKVGGLELACLPYEKHSTGATSRCSPPCRRHKFGITATRPSTNWLLTIVVSRPAYMNPTPTALWICQSCRPSPNFRRKSNWRSKNCWPSSGCQLQMPAASCRASKLSLCAHRTQLNKAK